ncbi:MAG TPA: HAD family acid phosphatase [Candidatus Limnocylindria bacterium]|nr:HAD family acid phosphatase [Candidatus Limnocylindria bacterium]
MNRVLFSRLMVATALISLPIFAKHTAAVQPSHGIKNFITCASEYHEPINIDVIKKQIKEFRTSGQWDKGITCVVDQAYAQLKKYMPVRNKKLAVIADIDDTSLSNYEFIVSNDFGYDHDRTKKWEMKGLDPAIAQVRDLCNFAKKNGFALFFITGRREDERQATERNLKNAGFKDWDKAYFKPMDFKGSSAVEFKQVWREHIMSQGYTLILNFGDQLTDFEGKAQAQYNFKIPNPMYIIR